MIRIECEVWFHPEGALWRSFSFLCALRRADVGPPLFRIKTLAHTLFQFDSIEDY
jgi:hypothetical protein